MSGCGACALGRVCCSTYSMQADLGERHMRARGCGRWAQGVGHVWKRVLSRGWGQGSASKVSKLLQMSTLSCCCGETDGCQLLLRIIASMVSCNASCLVPAALCAHLTSRFSHSFKLLPSCHNLLLNFQASHSLLSVPGSHLSVLEASFPCPGAGCLWTATSWQWTLTMR